MKIQKASKQRKLVLRRHEHRSHLPFVATLPNLQCAQNWHLVGGQSSHDKLHFIFKRQLPRLLNTISARQMSGEK